MFIVWEKTLKSVHMNHLGRAILLTLLLSLLFSKQAGQSVQEGLWSSPSQHERMTESQGTVATWSPAKKISRKGREIGQGRAFGLK